jgi:toxin ParE1/3/4
MKRHEVRLGRAAEQDLWGICEYIAQHDSLAKAEYVMDRVLEVIDSLEENPARGSHLRELLALGEGEYRQVFFKPYRIVYTVAQGTVHIVLIADGRRDMRTLLAQRLLSA